MFKIIQHLLPKALAWDLTQNKNLRNFFIALGNVFQDFRDFYDSIWEKIHPDTTDELDSWEKQFGLPNTLTIEQERRDRLSAIWQALGGQSPRYIQDTLQAAGFNVYVHEWWVPGTEPALDTLATATARNPFTYLNDNITPLQFLSLDNGPDMQDGDTVVAMDGKTVQPQGYPLVNKIYIFDPDYIADGAADAQDGDLIMQDGGIVQNGNVYNLKQYVMPSGTEYYPYYIYIGGQTFPDRAIVPSARRNELETLCLKICPTHLWIGMLIDYA